MKNNASLILLLFFVIIACKTSSSPTVNQNSAANSLAAPLPTEATPSNKTKKEIPKSVSDFIAELELNQKQGREMENLRKRADSQGAGECGELMRKRQKVADSLQIKGESLPQFYKTYLVPAAIDLKMCVSCSSGAIAACDRVKASISDMQNRLNED